MRMKKRIAKVLVIMACTPLILIVSAVFLAGSVLKSLSYLFIGKIKQAEDEIINCLPYE